MTTLEMAFATGFFCAAFSICPVVMILLLKDVKHDVPRRHPHR